MSLLKSLYCLHGFDNGRRFLVINLLSYLFFLFVSGGIAKAPILIVFLLVTVFPVLTTASIRRVRDSGVSMAVSLVAPIVFLLCVVGIGYLESGARWGLIVVAILTTLGVGLVGNPKVRRSRLYQFGYNGPIDFSNEGVTPDHHYGERIEPVLASSDSTKIVEAGIAEKSTGDNFELDYADSSENENVSRDRKYADNYDSFLDKLQNNPKLILILAGAILGLTLIVTVIGIMLDEEETVNELPEEKVVEQVVSKKQRLEKVEMPDSFWVMLDENDALTIAWQGDIKPDGEIWSTITGKGDLDCLEIRFTRNDTFRTIQVSVKNGGDYYADFSPVDTKALIEAVGLKDRFKLCGYEFSLKGTQAKLMNNRKYSTYFDE